MAKAIRQACSLPWRLSTHWNKTLIRWENRCGGPNYTAWLSSRHPSEATLQEQRRQFEIFAYQPLISVLLLGHDDVAAQETLKSLEQSTYPHWDFHRLVNHTTTLDAGLQIETFPDVLRLANENHSDLGRLLQTVKGEYTLVLSAGDNLTPHALYSMVETLNQAPAVADILYFDEDQLSPDGRASFNPFLKPDWSPELLLSVNYLKRAFFRSSRLQEVAQTAETVTEAIYSLAMQKLDVVHLPHILCHAHDDPLRPTTDPITMDAIQKSLSDRVSTSVLARTDSGQARFTWHVSDVLVSIIISTKDKASYLRACINSLLEKTDYRNFEIVLLDNGSTEPEAIRFLDEIRSHPQVNLIENPAPFNFSSFNNQGARLAQGDVLLFLNNDIEVIEPQWLEEMLQWALLPEIGVVGAKLLYPNGTIQHAGVVIGLEGHASHCFYGLPEGESGPFGSVDWYRNLSATTGACMMMRRNIYEQLGGFDEEYLLAFSDIELCLRVLDAGLRVMYTPFARLIHHEGRSRARYIPTRDIQRAYFQFKDYVAQGDPYYNPNLSYAICTPTLRRSREPNPLNRLEKIVHYSS
jgi:O-antigen biosynthesis protein